MRQRQRICANNSELTTDICKETNQVFETHRMLAQYRDISYEDSFEM